MTTTMPPVMPGSRRAVPHHPTEEHAKLLRDLLDQGEQWVLRGDWESYLRTGSPRAMVAITTLTDDHCVAAAAWLRQQRHALYRAIEGELCAPDGWLEARPLYKALTA